MVIGLVTYMPSTILSSQSPAFGSSDSSNINDGLTSPSGLNSIDNNNSGLPSTSNLKPTLQNMNIIYGAIIKQQQHLIQELINQQNSLWQLLLNNTLSVNTMR